MGLRARIAQWLWRSEVARHVRLMSYEDMFLRGRIGGALFGGDQPSGTAYSTHSTIQTCMRLKAQALEAMPYRIYHRSDTDRDRQPIDNHPVLALFPPLFFSQLSLNWDAGGNVWIIEQREGTGSQAANGKLPGGLRLLARNEIQDVRQGITYPIQGWKVREGGSWRYVTPEEICHIRFPVDPDSDDKLYGIGPLSALRHEFESDIAARIWNKATFRRGGRPETVLAYEPQQPGEDPWLDEDRRQAIKDAWDEEFGVASRTGGTAVLHAGFKLIKLGAPPKDMDFLGSTKLSREAIAAAFNMDPVLVGVTETGGIQDTRLKSARVMLYENAVLPMAAVIEAALQRYVIDKYAPDCVGVFARDEVPVLREDQLKLAQIAQIYTTALNLSPNNVIETLDLPFAKEEWGDEAFISAAYIPIGDALEPPEIPAIETTAKPVPTEESEDEDTEDEETEDEDTPPPPAKPKRLAPPRRAVSVTARDIVAARALRAQRAREAAREQWRGERANAFAKSFGAVERAFTRAVERFLRSQETELLDRLKASGAGRSIADLVRRILLNRKTADAKLRKLAEPYFQAAVRIGVQGAAADLGVSPMAIDDPYTLAFLEVKRLKIVDVNDTTIGMIHDELLDGLEQGETTEQLAARIREVFSTTPARSRKIARTEVASSVNGGRFQQFRKEGVTHIEWLSARDDHVRQAHRPEPEGVDGEIVELGKPFSNGLYYPGDPDGPPEEICNCRCTTLEYAAEDLGDEPEE